MVRKKQQNMAAAGPVQGLWDVPAGWTWKRLGEVAPATRPKILPVDFPEFKYIGMEHIEPHSGKQCGSDIFTNMKSAGVHFYKNDILYGRLRPYLNKVHLANEEGACSSEFIVLQASEMMHHKFLLYYLRDKHFVNYASRPENVTGERPRINYSTIAKYPLPLPPTLQEQQRIVARIEELFAELDKAEEALQSALLLCGYYRQAMLRDAVSGELSKEWRKAHPPRESGEQLLQRILAERRAAWEAAELKKMAAQGKKPTNDSWKKKYKEPQPPNTAGLLELPEGWCWASIPQVALVFNGKTPNGITEISESDGEYRWFRVSDMNANGNELIMKNGGLIISKEILHELCLQLLPSGTIVFPKRGGAIATNKKRILAFDAAIDLNLMGLCPITCYKRYFYTWFSSINLKKISNGSNVPQINNPDIDKVILPIPQANEAGLIANIITEFFSEIDEVESICQRELNSCKELRQSILNAAFTGKL